MSLAETTAALSKKESEKSQVLEDIKLLQQLKDQNIVAKLNASVHEINGLPDDLSVVFNYSLVGGSHIEKGNSHYSAKTLSEQIQFELLAKEGKILIECVFKNSGSIGDENSSELQCKVEFSVSEIPEVGELRTDISTGKITYGLDEEITITLKTKFSLDDIDLMITSKNLELEQLKQEFKDISAQIQEAKKKQISTTASSKKKLKGADVNKKSKKGGLKGAKPSSTNIVDVDEDFMDEHNMTSDIDDNTSSILENITSYAGIATAFTIENRAYALFVVFAVVIHKFGEYASV